MPNGLAAYPTNADGTPNPCFDPKRPWIYPNWWDTWEESTCKYGIGANVNPQSGGEGTAASGLDSTLSSLAGIVIVLGLASMALNLYVGKR